MVTDLRKCEWCGLLYRAPTIDFETNNKFYQLNYIDGERTIVPEESKLNLLMESSFSGTTMDYSKSLSILNALGTQSGARVVEFGCSWGYGAWQFQRQGYQTEGVEVSVPRAEFGRTRLGVCIRTTLNDVQPGCNIFHSHHVLEHMSDPGWILRRGRELLRKGGLFIAFTPNGSDAYRKREPENWHRAWGRVHPSFLTPEYYEHFFSDLPRAYVSSPYDLEQLSRLSLDAPKVQRLSDDGPELLFIAKKT